MNTSIYDTRTDIPELFRKSINPSYISPDREYGREYRMNNDEPKGSRGKVQTQCAPAEYVRVALQGDAFHIKEKVLTVVNGGEGDESYFEKIRRGDTFRLQSSWGEITGKVSHVITESDSGPKYVCLIFDGNLHFEGDLSGVEFQIPG